ncbi:MAG: hypothetical protein AAGF11_41630, partial [Myxococcota bacterium]
MRSAIDPRWVLAAVMGLALPACNTGDGDDDAAMDEDTGTSGEGTSATDGEESVDETGDGASDGASDGAGASGSSGGSEETGEDLGPWDSLEERPCPEDSILTYENFGGPFMLNFCTGCHQSMLPADMRQDAPLEVNFDDIEDIRVWADRIWARSAD